MKPICIDRCACYDCRFAEMAEVAKAEGIRTVAELKDHLEFGQNCELCIPYVAEMLRTGETVFHRIIVRQEGDSGESRE